VGIYLANKALAQIAVLIGQPFGEAAQIIDHLTPNYLKLWCARQDSNLWPPD
jgi:hypothetical protein